MGGETSKRRGASTDAVMQTLAWIRRQGFEPTAVHPRSKAVDIDKDEKGDGKYDYAKPGHETPPDDLWHARNRGVGVVTGPQRRGPIDVDLDCPEARWAAKKFLPPTTAIFGRESSKDSHWFYRLPEGELSFPSIRFKDIDGTMILEIRGDDAQDHTVMPGSIHKETGELIEWTGRTIPDGVTVCQGAAPIRGGEMIAAFVIVVRHFWKPGTRNAMSAHVPGMFAHWGWSEADVTKLLEAVMEYTGDADPDRTLNRIKETFRRKATGETFTGSPSLREESGAEAAVDLLAKWFAPKDSASNFVWPDPVDPFSASALPKFDLTWLFPVPRIRRYVRLVSKQLGMETGSVAMAAITAYEGALSDQLRVQVKEFDDEWTEAPRLWTALVGEPSAMKSPVISRVTKAVERIQSVHMKAYREELHAWDSENDGKKKDDQTPKPIEPHALVVQSFTPEGIQKALIENPHGILIATGELSGVIGQFDKFGGKGNDKAECIELWDGKSKTVLRAGQNRYVPNYGASILGGIQPDLLQRQNLQENDGFLARFNPVIMGPVGIDTDEPLSREDREALRDFEALIEDAIESRELPWLYEFDEAAREIVNALRTEKRQLMNALGSVSPRLSAWCGKMDVQFARIVVALHRATIVNFEMPDWMKADSGKGIESLPKEAFAKHARGFIGADVTRTADRIVREFLLPHAIYFYTEILGESGPYAQAKRLADTILVHGELTRIRMGDWAALDRETRKVDPRELRRWIDVLVMWGWLEPEGKPWDCRAWKINPKVRELFAARAAEQKAERDQRRETILAYCGGKARSKGDEG